MLHCMLYKEVVQSDVSLSHVSSLGLCSFGMVLTRGHGRLMFMGNVSVEEGTFSHNPLQHRLRFRSGIWDSQEYPHV